MRHALLDSSDNNQASEMHRHAYNVAFDSLGLSWHWESATYARLQDYGRDCVLTYLRAEQSHLLSAYEADFLVQAIETAKARCYQGMTSSRVFSVAHGSLTTTPHRIIRPGLHPSH